jgi:UDP-2,4-diacetamido-2,4,6-trideoxy-beta-L-altropyranose hydrolase
MTYSSPWAVCSTTTEPKPVGPIIFRTGGGERTGYGHVRRCLSLAEALRGCDAESAFLLDGDQILASDVEAAGFESVWVDTGNDLVNTLELARRRQARAIVADSYALDSEYFQGLIAVPAATVVVDDLADRELPVDLVVNSSVAACRGTYRGAEGTTFLLGPKYALLRPEFADTPTRREPEDVRTILVTVGGSDPHGLTQTFTRCIATALPEAYVDIIVGPLALAPTCLIVGRHRVPSSVKLHRNPRDIRRLMLEADLALCAGGQTAYELAACGVPMIAARTADNQTGNLEGLAAAGALIWAGDARDEGLEATVMTALVELAGDPSWRDRLGKRGRAIVDGKGADRVASAILQLIPDSQP